MHVKSATLIRVLLNRFVKGSSDAALKVFPREEEQQIFKTEISSKDYLAAFDHPFAKIQKIHYSWILPIMKKLSKEGQPMAIAALPHELGQKVCLSLELPYPSPSIPELLKMFIVAKVYEKLNGASEVLPLEYLPSSGMFELKDWTKLALVELTEFLGIHDLAEELRRIVSKKTLQSVYQCLTPKEEQYLKICMHAKEKVSTPSLGLEKWNGDRLKFKSALQTRGLIRFGKALSGEHPDFLWHLSHTLDTGRGQTLLKYYSPKAVPGITPVLVQQVRNLINFLKKEE